MDRTSQVMEQRTVASADPQVVLWPNVGDADLVALRIDFEGPDDSEGQRDAKETGQAAMPWRRLLDVKARLNIRADHYRLSLP